MIFNSHRLKLLGIENLVSALRTLVFVSTFFALSNCQVFPTDNSSPRVQPSSGTRTSNITSGLEDYLPVDCLLPGKIRKLGGRAVFVTARRPIRTTANRCEIRGGEYTSFDQANYETALGVWLKQAKTGDVKAQTYVGEIYEKGMGRTPDYRTASKWYKQAADQGYFPAQNKLGVLYEKGLGVPQNKEIALQLYRRASGLEDLGIQFGASTEIGKLKEDLIKQRNQGQERLQQLKQELEQLTRESNQLQEERERMEEERKKLRKIEQKFIDEELTTQKQRLTQKEHVLKGKEQKIYARSLKLENKKQSLEAQEKDLLIKRQEITRQELDNSPKDEQLSLMKNFNIDYGKSYALIIGISKYKKLKPLQTAANDAKEIKKVLKTKYDFTHIDLLVDEEATYEAITKKLIFYQENLVPQDNFLIYYAGHGKVEKEEGYWLPVDAHNDIHMKTNWISNKNVSGLASNFRAKHVIIVADSCYSGAIATQGTTPWAPSDLSIDKQKIWFERMMKKPGVRMSLTSGGLKPVYDNLGGSHSFFAEALLTVLEKNTQKYLATSTVWNQIGNYMYGHLSPKKFDGILRGNGQNQVNFEHFSEPRYRSLDISNQSIGQFFFVLKS